MGRMPEELQRAVSTLREKPRFGDVHYIAAHETRKKFVEVKCWRCDGRGRSITGQACDTCEGSGRLWQRK